MKAIAAILLVLCHLTVSHGWNCDEGPRLYNARQIDAGQGKVVATDRNNYPYFLIGSSWQRLSSIRFRHLSVGPAGLWGCTTSNIVYKYVAGNFVQSRGTPMKQVDAGGDDQLVGVTTSNQAYCLRCSSALTYRGVGSLGWSYLSRRLKYYTCSPKNGCWGVDTSNRVYFTRTLNSVNCGASGWTQVAGQHMSMVEVGTDGRVFGLTLGGDVYQRAGIYTGRPYPGTSWVRVPMCMRIRHLSYDLNNLWVVSNSGLVLKCTG
ncbi:fish-egg lectin-like [Epinephelus fuscoguttatus]|uniref:fish-egg lectin-like n=1 Tax=Epinephelus fuscoguttatus TaxID=293821 RepID=UPI0020D08499|nr:fish-egg lectin-like [Epinephelus fuscoguttatus]